MVTEPFVGDIRIMVRKIVVKSSMETCDQGLRGNLFLFVAPGMIHHVRTIHFLYLVVWKPVVHDTHGQCANTKDTVNTVARLKVRHLNRILHSLAQIFFHVRGTAMRRPELIFPASVASY
jgi:hypothetical protein